MSLLPSRSSSHRHVELVQGGDHHRGDGETIGRCQDKENGQRYRDQRKVLRREFAQVIASSLAPDQAAVFTSLPEREQRPDGSSGYHIDSQLISNSGLPGENGFMYSKTSGGVTPQNAGLQE